jgi:hypothetical protein
LNALWRLGGSFFTKPYLTAKRHSKAFNKIQTTLMDFPHLNALWRLGGSIT